MRIRLRSNVPEKYRGFCRNRSLWLNSLRCTGAMVPIKETIRGFRMILDGELDEYPEMAFLNVGTIDEAIEKGKNLLKQSDQ